MTTFDFAQQRPSRRPSLTPMIDVVFLLLVFFMLAARFGSDSALILTPPAVSQNAPEWVGPPRLVELSNSGVTLNGIATTLDSLIPDLSALMTAPSDPILLRATPDASLQAMIDLIEHLQAAGLSAPVLVD